MRSEQLLLTAIVQPYACLLISQTVFSTHSRLRMHSTVAQGQPKIHTLDGA